MPGEDLRLKKDQCSAVSCISICRYVCDFAVRGQFLGPVQGSETLGNRSEELRSEGQVGSAVRVDGDEQLVHITFTNQNPSAS